MPLHRSRAPVVALCLFKEGVEPRAKHKTNARGGKWSSLQIARRGERVGLGGPPANHLETGLIDNLWNNMVFGCVGETIDAGDEITGARVVDQRQTNRGVGCVRARCRHPGSALRLVAGR